MTSWEQPKQDERDDSQRIFRAISEVLAREYGTPRHGNPEEPLDDLVYLMLTRKSPIEQAEEVYNQFVEEIGHDWGLVLERGAEYVREKTETLGMGRQRPMDIMETLDTIRETFGDLNLTQLQQCNDEECESFLTSLPGVGPKTARCVMLYALGREVFPADAHCIRVLGRVGIIPPEVAQNHRRAQRMLADLVPREVAYELHVNLIAHGQAVCPPRNPDCTSSVPREV